ncbi:MAG TPA: hypothetical protein DDZ76_06455 [Xanthomonadales bacterium]|nr:hypothetical protein [Xanthomonadales bacterium]
MTYAIPVRRLMRHLALAPILVFALLACSTDADPPPKPTEAERTVLYWYDPMRPDVHFDAPGRSPFMDMDLVPMYADADDDPSGAGAVAVSDAVIQSLGIRIGRVEAIDLRPSLRVPARVRADPDSRWMLFSRVEGWVEALAVHEVGESVRAGQVLLDIYSPQLVQAQEELLLDAERADAAAERLRRLGIADRDIQAIRQAGVSQRHLPLRSAVTGTIAAINVHLDARAMPEQPLLEVVAEDRVWVDARLFPGQAEQLGTPVSARFRRLGEDQPRWHGENGFLYPSVDPTSQTQALRFVIAESSRRLPPGAWLDAELFGPLRPNVLSLPAEAVIRSGQGTRVVRRDDDGRFVPIDVELGTRYGDRYEVRAGLSAGDDVVLSGQFLLDSEADLKSGLRRMSGAGSERASDAEPSGDHPHADSNPASEQEQEHGHAH